MSRFIKTNNANGNVTRKIDGKPETGFYRIRGMSVQSMRDFMARTSDDKGDSVTRSIRRDIRRWLKIHGSHQATVVQVTERFVRSGIAVSEQGLS